MGAPHTLDPTQFGHTAPGYSRRVEAAEAAFKAAQEALRRELDAAYPQGARVRVVSNHLGKFWGHVEGCWTSEGVMVGVIDEHDGLCKMTPYQTVQLAEAELRRPSNLQADAVRTAFVEAEAELRRLSNSWR